jgi:hypothetical protein
MPGSAHSRAWAGLWNRAVASNTARPAAAGSATASSPWATPSAMIRASWPAVDAAVADAQGAGDVDHGRLGGPVAAQDVLCRLQDPRRRQRLVVHLAAAPARSLSRVAICGA